jgi:FMN phosphatase YigB (HAD superfamily)
MRPTRTQYSPLYATTKIETQTLGLLTFDLDDTLYPIAPVEAEANEAFVEAMAQYGFSGLKPNDIVKTAKEIRAELLQQDPQKAAVLTHTEIRELAIRREMEKATVAKKLQALAEDEATTVGALSKLIKENAQK